MRILAYCCLGAGWLLALFAALVFIDVPLATIEGNVYRAFIDAIIVSIVGLAGGGLITLGRRLRHPHPASAAPPVAYPRRRYRRLS